MFFQSTKKKCKWQNLPVLPRLCLQLESSLKLSASFLSRLEKERGIDYIREPRLKHAMQRDFHETKDYKLSSVQETKKNNNKTIFKVYSLGLVPQHWNAPSIDDKTKAFFFLDAIPVKKELFWRIVQVMLLRPSPHSFSGRFNTNSNDSFRAVCNTHIDPTTITTAAIFVFFFLRFYDLRLYLKENRALIPDSFYIKPEKTQSFYLLFFLGRIWIFITTRLKKKKKKREEACVSFFYIYFFLKKKKGEKAPHTQV